MSDYYLIKTAMERGNRDIVSAVRGLATQQEINNDLLSELVKQQQLANEIAYQQLRLDSRRADRETALGGVENGIIADLNERLGVSDD